MQVEVDQTVDFRKARFNDKILDLHGVSTDAIANQESSFLVPLFRDLQ